MARGVLRIACWDYDRVAALADGRVGVEGYDVAFTTLSPHAFFHRAAAIDAFDVIEQSFSSYMASLSRGPTRYPAVPVFPSRMFRLSAIYVRTDSGIATPEDLKGRRVGVPLYAITAAMTARGMLSDAYGIRPADIMWINAGLESPKEFLSLGFPLPAGVRVEDVRDRSLVDMICAGELDAILSAAEPSCFAEGDPRIARLFPDYRAAERDYFRETGVFPIMHVIGIRAGLLENDPRIASAVFRAFDRAKALAIAQMTGAGGAAKVTLPWVNAEIEDTIAAMGRDYWPYGVEPNRATLSAMTRWSLEQGLSARPLSVEELFVPCDELAPVATAAAAASDARR